MPFFEKTHLDRKCHELRPLTPWWCSTKTSFPRHCYSKMPPPWNTCVWFRLCIALRKYTSLKYAHFEKKKKLVKVPFHRSGHISWTHSTTCSFNVALLCWKSQPTHVNHWPSFPQMVSETWHAPAGKGKDNTVNSAVLGSGMSMLPTCSYHQLVQYCMGSTIHVHVATRKPISGVCMIGCEQ